MAGDRGRQRFADRGEGQAVRDRRAAAVVRSYQRHASRQQRASVVFPACTQVFGTTRGADGGNGLHYQGTLFLLPPSKAS